MRELPENHTQLQSLVNNLFWHKKRECCGMRAEKIITEYSTAYNSLYKRSPSQVEDLGNEWVLVNGARMSLTQLEQLTQQLNQEIKALQDKKNIVKRLMRWFTTA